MSDVSRALQHLSPESGTFGRNVARAKFYRWFRSGLLVAIADLGAAELVADAAYLLLTRSEPAIATLRLSAPALFFAGASVVAANAWMGLYGSAALGTVERFRRRIFAGLLMPWLAVAVIAWDRPLNMMIVGLFILVAAMLVPLGMICEAALRRIWPFVCRGNTLLVGSAAFGDQFAALLEARPELGLRPIGIVNDAPDATSSLRWLGRVSDLRSLAADVDVVAVLPPLDLLTVTRLRLPVGRIVVLSDADADAVTTSSLAGRHIGAATVFELHNPSLEGVARQVKRFLELCIAIPALILSAPLIGLVAIVIKITSPGPALYAQYRVGLRGEPVPVHKLRSMYPDAERRLEQLLADDAAALSEWNRYMKLKRDPRILPYIGAFIRKTSIDELPQLWDVVRGTMALVGPRPFPDYHVTKFSPEFQSLRASVKPGLTGLWQVSDRSDADLRQQEILDTFYIRNWSLWLDAYIVARTFSAVLFSQGAR